MQNSGRFSLTSITGSPGLNPCACNALASAATSWATSVQLSDFHWPATLRQRKGVSPIAAAALSVPDAEQLVRLIKRGPVKLRLSVTPQFKGEAESGNVIADLPGSDPKAGYVMAGAHLDSWVAGDGAADNGAGTAMIMEAADISMVTRAPRRRSGTYRQYCSSRWLQLRVSRMLLRYSWYRGALRVSENS